MRQACHAHRTGAASQSSTRQLCSGGAGERDVSASVNGRAAGDHVGRARARRSTRRGNAAAAAARAIAVLGQRAGGRDHAPRCRSAARAAPRCRRSPARCGQLLAQRSRSRGAGRSAAARPAMLASSTPPGRSTRATSATNAGAVSSAGTRAPRNASSTTTSAPAAGSAAQSVDAVDRRGPGCRCGRAAAAARAPARISASSGSSTTWLEPGRVAATYRASVQRAAADMGHRQPGRRAGARSRRARRPWPAGTRSRGRSGRRGRRRTAAPGRRCSR